MKPQTTQYKPLWIYGNFEGWFHHAIYAGMVTMTTKHTHTSNHVCIYSYLQQINSMHLFTTDILSPLSDQRLCLRCVTLLKEEGPYKDVPIPDSDKPHTCDGTTNVWTCSMCHETIFTSIENSKYHQMYVIVSVCRCVHVLCMYMYMFTCIVYMYCVCNVYYHLCIYMYVCTCIYMYAIHICIDISTYILRCIYIYIYIYI